MRLTFRQIKSSFVEGLNNLYPPEEIEAIFRLCIEEVFNDSYINVSLNSFSEGNMEITKLNEIKRRLLLNEPIQHILGKAFFYNLEFKVNPDVLIPRQETELLVDILINRSKQYKSPEILDIGTGSGCIAISLKKNIPEATVHALDISPVALSTAQENSINSHTQINFIEGNILKWNNISFPTLCDIIVSNPPYIPINEKNSLPNNVKHFDPQLALFVTDSDPLLFYKKICLFANEYLKNNGILAFEINEALGVETVSVVNESGFSNIELIKDLNGKDRIVIAEKHE